MELFLSVILGIGLGLFFFISANRFAHRNLETSFLWLFIASVLVFGLLFIGIYPLTFLGCIILTTTEKVVRKIIIHQKNVNRLTYAVRYKKWLWIFFFVLILIYIIYRLIS